GTIIHSKIFLIPFSLLVLFSINIIIYQFYPYYYDLFTLRHTYHSFIQKFRITKDQNSEIEQFISQVSEISVINKDEKTKADSSRIYFRKNDTGEELYWATLQNVDNYEPVIFLNNNLYVVHKVGARKKDSVSDRRSEELRRYDFDKNTYVLLKGEFINPYVISDNKLLVLYNNRSLVLFQLSNGADSIVLEGDFAEENPSGSFSINRSPSKLGASSNIIWIENQFGPRYAIVGKIDLGKLTLKQYPIFVGLSGSAAFNDAQELIADSDYPFEIHVLDIEGAEVFEKGEKKVSLYLYDMSTTKKYHIAEGYDDSFRTNWLNHNTLEFSYQPTIFAQQITSKLFVDTEMNVIFEHNAGVNVYRCPDIGCASIGEYSLQVRELMKSQILVQNYEKDLLENDLYCSEDGPIGSTYCENLSIEKFSNSKSTNGYKITRLRHKNGEGPRPVDGQDDYEEFAYVFPDNNSDSAGLLFAVDWPTEENLKHLEIIVDTVQIMD
ncbi:MAG: hypothetical protein NUV98_04355, partial [Candidatus Roizmanbacteria bacterium]|nr:hypothetical protein [Candidatus Roizmanbacteria bacterium]